MDKLCCPYCGAPITNNTKCVNKSLYAELAECKCSVCGATFFADGSLGWPGDLSHLTDDFKKKLDSEITKIEAIFIAEPNMETAEYLLKILKLHDRYFAE